jgi:signal transduction histidine kinase/HAMP domain-containing protein
MKVWSLRRRLQLTLAGVSVLVALFAGLGVAALDHLGNAIATILRDNYASVIACEQMNEALERQDSAAQFASAAREDIGRPMLAQNRIAFERALAAELANVTLPGEGDEARAIATSYRLYVAEVDRVLAGPPDARGAGYFHDLLPAFTELERHVHRVLEMNQSAMEDADAEAKALARRTVRIAIAVGLLAIALAAYLALRLPRTIVEPIERLRHAAVAIGDGELDVEVEQPEVAEMLPLASALRVMVDKLRAYRDSSLGELLEAKDTARATLECMLDPVIVFDADGAVRYANQAAERAFDLQAASAEDLARRELPPGLAEARARVLEGRGPVLPRSLSEAMRWRTPEGEKDYLVRALPLQSGAGDPKSAIVVAQDVTRYRRIDELKSDMVATVSHQFKTPLTSLRMATHLLLEPATGALAEGQRELVETARDEAERLRAMVDDLLDVVRIESEAGALHRVAVEPFGLLSEVADAHRGVAREAGVEIEVERPKDGGLVSIDPERASIAIANLVSNAIRYSRSGGRVKLAARRDRGELAITVRDEGAGMSPEVLARLFDKKASGGRRGLGLIIAREIALRHGGDITVESALERGTSFTLTFGAGDAG